MEEMTVTITLSEYRALIVDSAMLQNIKKYTKSAKYLSDTKDFVERMCFDEAEEEGDAE